MLATTGTLPAGPGWAYEFKWDGVRAIAHIDDGTARFYARSGAEITVAYPELAGLGRAVAGSTTPAGTVLDGEIVSLDDGGRPSFAALADRMHVRDPHRAARLATARPVTYLIFDLLRLAGEDCTAWPYERRRAALDDLGLAGDHWYVPPSFTDGPATRAAALEYGLEGVMAKRVTSAYRPGIRSIDWVKFKIDQTDEFVVGGWRPGARTLGALLIGVPEPAATRLAYRGRVGGGISAASEKALLSALRPLATTESPFGQAVPRPDAKDATWVRPELVIEVKYGEQTADGRLRFPRFLRIRPDLRPEDL